MPLNGHTTSSPIAAAGALALPALALSTFAVACGPARPTVVEIAAAKGSEAPAEGSPAGPEDAATGSGCTWTGEAVWARNHPLPLCFDKESACFATAPSPFTGEASVWLPPGEPARTGARLDLAEGGIRLRAWTDGAEVVLHPGGPTVFGQIAIPTRAEKIFADRVIDRNLELSLRSESGFAPRGGVLRARAPCTDLGLDHKPYSEEAIRAAAGIRSQALGERTLPTGQALSISGAVSGPVMADVTPEDSDTRVEVLEQSGGRSRIFWWRDDLVLVGWVDTAALGPPPGSIQGFGYGTGRGRLAPDRKPGTRCSRDVSLFAQVHGTRQKVGLIEKGTVFDRGLSTHDMAFFHVVIRSPAFELTPDSGWIVPSAALTGCKVE